MIDEKEPRPIGDLIVTIFGITVAIGVLFLVVATVFLGFSSSNIEKVGQFLTSMIALIAGYIAGKGTKSE